MGIALQVGMVHGPQVSSRLDTRKLSVAEALELLALLTSNAVAERRVTDLNITQVETLDEIEFSIISHRYIGPERGQQIIESKPSARNAGFRYHFMPAGFSNDQSDFDTFLFVAYAVTAALVASNNHVFCTDEVRAALAELRRSAELCPDPSRR